MVHADERTFDALSASRPISGRDVRHVDGCVRCRRIAAERGISETAIASAVTAVRARRRSLVTAGVAAAAVALAAAAIPLRSTAYGFFAIFEPHTVRALPLTLDDMRSLNRLPELSAYATTRELQTPRSANFNTVGAAAAAAGFALRQPAYVPDGIRTVSYQVDGPSSQVLTFGAAGSSPAGSPAARLPADIAGSTLRIDLGPTVVATYETAESAADEQRLAAATRRFAAANPTAPTATVIPGGPRMQNGGRRMYSSGAPRKPHTFFIATGARMGMLPLVMVQMPVPRVASTGVSVARLVSFMLAQPGVPLRVAAAFGALGDLSTTLPIPVPIDKAYTQPVTVDGVQGVGLGDDTGIGAAVVWQKSGMLYAVFAPRTAREVLAIASSLR